MLLEAIRRWHISVARNTHELSQATPSNITPERRNDVLGVDSGEYPEPTFLLHRLNIRRPDQTAIRKSLMWPRAKVTKDDADCTARVDMYVHEISGDQALVVLVHSPSNAKKVKV